MYVNIVHTIRDNLVLVLVISLVLLAYIVVIEMQ